MRSLWNQTVREKIWVRMTESHPIQRSPSMNCLAEFIDGAFWNTPLQPDQWIHASDRSLSWHERNPRTAAIIRSKPATSMPLARSREEDDPTSHRNKPQGSSTQPPPQPKRPVATAARHGSYVSAPPRKSSDPRLSAAPTTPLPHVYIWWQWI
jgi:hypothetical protein